MQFRRWVVISTLALLASAPAARATPRFSPGAPAPRVQKARQAIANIDNNDRMDVNNLDMVVTNHGSISYDLETGNAGLIYPKGSTKTAVFAAGLWIGAKVDGQIRLAVGEYSQEFTPGPMLDGTFQADRGEFRNYRIERGGIGYSDYLTYAVPQGAPVDSLGNPLQLGDALIWSVFNDADPGVHTNDAGSTAPLGVEVQQSIFAFNRSGPLGNVIFVKWKILNKGANRLDSTYVSVWSDPDLGGFTDDLVGCDTTLSLGYCYNATNADGLYGTKPPAVGYDFFRGPITDVDNDGDLDTLGMTSFNKYINGTDPAAPSETYNYMRGVNGDSSEIHVCYDPSLPVTSFQVSGLNPGAAPTCPGNWLDSNPADRRLFLSSGPFTMMPGDSQEVVTAIIIGQGSDRISSIADLKNSDGLAQLVFDLGFDIPAPPPSPTVYVQPMDRAIRLVWGNEPVGYTAVSDTLNQEFHFEGFRVWQLSSNSSSADPTVIATFDIANGVTNIYSDEINQQTGYKDRILKVVGTDTGLQFQLDITQDQILGGNLINNRSYYYAVTAYAYDINNDFLFISGKDTLGIVSEVLESARNPIPVAPLSSSAVLNTTATYEGTSPLNVDGSVVVEQLDQNAITGDSYLVTFDDLEHWWLINATTGDTLLADQTNVSGDFSYPVTEGFMARVIAPRGVAQMGELNADSTITDMSPGNTDSTGTWLFGGSLPFVFFGATNHDYEIRILPDTTQYAWKYASGEVSTVASYKVPFEIWDLGFNSLSDPSDDVKISAMVRDTDNNFQWSLTTKSSTADRLYFRQIPYDIVAWTTPGTSTADYGDGISDQTLGGFRFIKADTSYHSVIPPPTTIRLIGQRFTSQDVYTFRTLPVGAAPGTVVGTDLKKCLAVPNPYYAHSQYELTQFDRVLKFTNIPASRKVVLRIFNMGGDLVRTIAREPTSADQMAMATINWDLNTERNLPVASGVYIWHIDVDGVGSKTDRVAVFIEEERLDNF